MRKWIILGLLMVIVMSAISSSEEFIDNTDTDFDAGSNNNFPTHGTGSDANITSSGSFGHFFKILDAGASANWTNITLVLDANYGIEIGRAKNDVNDGILPYINTSGLVLLMHFNNNSGVGEDDSLVRDFSVDVNSEREGETHNNGTVEDGGSSYNFVTKKLGDSSMNFNGGSDPAINVIQSKNINNLGKFTIMSWIFTESEGQSNQGRIADKRGFSTGWAINMNPLGTNGLEFVVDYDTTDILVTTSDNTIILNRWQHIVVTYDGGLTASTSVNIYIDGLETTYGTQQNAVGDRIDDSARDFGIGEIVDSDIVSFDGNIDELSLWNRTLSPAEILNIYKRGAWELNISAAVCDDASCAGETFTNIQPNNISSGFTIPLNLTTTEQFFGYNITYENSSAYGVNVTVNNITIDTFLIAEEGDTTVPVINGTLNISLSSIVQADVLNITYNFTDDSGNVTWVNISINYSTGTRWYNFSIEDSSLTTRTISQNFTVDDAAGHVWNVSAIISDNSSNQAKNDTIFTITTADSCSCPSSGDFEIINGDVCTITSICNLETNFFRVLDGKVRIESGGAIRAQGCFIADISSFYANEDSGGLSCGNT